MYSREGCGRPRLTAEFFRALKHCLWRLQHWLGVWLCPSLCPHEYKPMGQCVCGFCFCNCASPVRSRSTFDILGLCAQKVLQRSGHASTFLFLVPKKLFFPAMAPAVKCCEQSFSFTTIHHDQSFYRCLPTHPSLLICITEPSGATTTWLLHTKEL